MATIPTFESMIYGEAASRNLAAHIVAAYGLRLLDQSRPVTAIALADTIFGEMVAACFFVPVKATTVTKEVKVLSLAGVVDAVRDVADEDDALIEADDLVQYFPELDPESFKGAVHFGEVAKEEDGIPPKVFHFLRAYLRDAEGMIAEADAWIATHSIRFTLHGEIDELNPNAPWTRWPSE